MEPSDARTVISRRFPEAVVASVQSGADAIYMGFGGFNARRNAKNFTDEEFEAAVRYCRVRGCKVYVTLNTLVSDRELARRRSSLKKASDLGVDAIIVQDMACSGCSGRSCRTCPFTRARK
jgi:putative protease